MYRLWHKLMESRKDLRKLNKEEFDGISKKVIKCKQMLEALQIDLQQDPFNQVLVYEERAIFQQYRRLLE